MVISLLKPYSFFSVYLLKAFIILPIRFHIYTIKCTVLHIVIQVSKLWNHWKLLCMIHLVQGRKNVLARILDILAHLLLLKSWGTDNPWIYATRWRSAFSCHVRNKMDLIKEFNRSVFLFQFFMLHFHKWMRDFEFQAHLR